MSDSLRERIDAKSPNRDRSQSPRRPSDGYRRERQRSITPPSRFSRRSPRYRSRSRSRSYSRSPPPRYRRRSPPPPHHYDRDRRGGGPRFNSRSRPIHPPPKIMPAREKSQQERRVYVGNLAYEVRWHQLKDFMKQAGEVIFADVLTLADGRSKGCGIVEYATKEEAAQAVDTLSNQMLMGRLIYVREDREQLSDPRGPPPPPPARHRGAPPPPWSRFERERERDQYDQYAPPPPRPGCQLFVSNLPYSCGWQDLKDLFRQAGNIIRADVNQTRDGRSKGTGIVLFDSPRDADNAIDKFNGYEMGGRPLEVREDRFPEKSRRPPPPPPGALPPGRSRSRSPPPPPGPSEPTGTSGNEFTDGASANGPQSDTIFVGNLPWSTTNQDLVELFETVGNVDRAEIKFLANGRSSGSGVVKFDTPGSAEIAINKFDQYNYGNRDLALSYVAYENGSRDANEPAPAGGDSMEVDV